MKYLKKHNELKDLTDRPNDKIAYEVSMFLREESLKHICKK